MAPSQRKLQYALRPRILDIILNMDTTTGTQHGSDRPGMQDSPIKNSELAPNSDKENNDFLPVSVLFKPRKPSSSRLAAEIQRHEEEKRIEAERLRQDELKKYTHLAMASKPTPQRGGRSAGDSYNNAVSLRLSEIASHREVMVAQEEALARAEDRMRRGKNRANDVQPDLTLGVERVLIKTGNHKRDYSYVKGPSVAEHSADVTSAKFTSLPVSDSRVRRPVSGKGTRGVTSDTYKLANIILDTPKAAAEQSKDLLLQGVIMSKDKTHMSEDERNIVEFLRANSPTADIHSDSAAREADSITYTSADEDLVDKEGIMLDGGGMSLTFSRGIASPVHDSRVKNEVASMSQKSSSTKADDAGGDAIAVKPKTLFAPQPVYAASQDKLAVEALTQSDVTSTDDTILSKNVQDAEVTSIKEPAAAVVRKLLPTAPLTVAASSKDHSAPYSPDSSIESAQEVPGEISPAPRKGGVFSQPSVVVGENEEAPAGDGESLGMGLNLKKYVQLGKKGGSASILSKNTGKNLSGLVIHNTSVNAKASVNVPAALTAVKEEESVADLRNSPIALPHTANNAQESSTTSADVEVSASAGAATNLREKFNQAISLDQQVNEGSGAMGGAGASASRERGTAKALRAQTAQQPLRVTGAQARPHSANGALPSSSKLDLEQSAQQTCHVMSKTASGHSIIAKNMLAAAAYKIPAGSVNAQLTSSFRSEIGGPTEKESTITALKKQGKISHMPLERVVHEGRVADEEAITPQRLAIDDSCLLSPAPLTFSASKSKALFPHSPTSEALLQQISEEMPQVQRPPSQNDAHFSVRYSPTSSKLDNSTRGKEFQLFTDIHNTMQNVKDIYAEKRKGSPNNEKNDSPIDSVDRPRGHQVIIPNDRDMLSEKMQELEMTDSFMLGESLATSLVNSVQETKSVTWPINELSDAAGAAAEEQINILPSAAPLSAEAADQVSADKKSNLKVKSAASSAELVVKTDNLPPMLRKQSDASNATLLHSFPSVRLDGFRGSSNETLLHGDSLTGSVLGMLSTGRGEANNAVLSLSPYPTSTGIGAVGALPLHPYETAESKTGMNTINTKDGDRVKSSVTKATPASKAKMKVRGIESWASEYTSLEEKRNIAKYSWMQLQTRLQLGKDRLRNSAAVTINDTLTSDELVHEPAEHILNSEIMQSFDALQKQCDKYTHIANDDITQEDIEHILRMHEKAKRAEAQYEQRLRHRERKNQRRIMEVVEKSGLRREDVVYPGIHISVPESKKGKPDETIQTENTNDQNVLTPPKKESKHSRKAKKRKVYDALGKEVFIGDHHMDNMDHDVAQGTLGDFNSPANIPAHTNDASAVDVNGGDTKPSLSLVNFSKSRAAIAESLELGMAESTFVAAKSFEVLDSGNMHEVIINDASGAIAIGASALETSLDFGLDNPPDLRKADSAHHTQNSTRKYPLTYLFNDSVVDEFRVDDSSCSSLFKDSIYSYSRNQTQTIHAPAAHGSMLRAGVGIQRNKPGYSASTQSGNGGTRNNEIAMRPSSAAATGTRQRDPSFFDAENVDITLDQSFSSVKLRISGKAANNNATMPAVSTFDFPTNPDVGFTDAYSMNNQVSYKSNIPSIRDSRMQEREKYFYKQEYEMRNAVPENAAGRGSKRPSSAGATRVNNAAPTPKAAEVGLRMVNWKYGSLVRVEDDDNQVPKKPTGKSKKSKNDQVTTDDEFVASALLKGAPAYLAENSVASDMWRYQSLSLNGSQDELFNTLTRTSEAGADDIADPLSLTDSVTGNNGNRVDLSAENSTSDQGRKRISRKPNEIIKRKPIRVIPSHFNVDQNTLNPQSRHIYAQGFIENELKKMQVTGGQPILNDSRRNGGY